MFTPEMVELPGVWPACRHARCGSTVAVARVVATYGPVTATCENGHFRAYHGKEDFRRGRRYAGLFSENAVAADAPRGRAVRLPEPSVRRRAEVLEDAERCALCGTPPAEHPYRPDLEVRADREVVTWLQRWRPALYAELLAAVAIAARRERVASGGWRSALPSRLREAVVRALEDSALETDLLVPAERLAPLAETLPPGQLDFAVNRLLLAVCRACNDGRARRSKSAGDYVREYVTAFCGGDERLARADVPAWRAVEAIASAAASARVASDARSA